VVLRCLDKNQTEELESIIGLCPRLPFLRLSDGRMKNWLRGLWDNARIITLRIPGGYTYSGTATTTRYEAAWTDSGSFRRCLHRHQTLIEAAKCAMPSGCGWYVVAVEGNSPRQLTDTEERMVNEFRFALKGKAAGSS